MATVRPHQGHPQPPPPQQQQPAAVPRPDPCARICGAADAHGRKEGVAESCCPAPDAVADDGGSDEEDGCGSCVDGSEGSAGRDEEVAGEEVVWSWSQESGGGCLLWPPPHARRASCGHAGDAADDEVRKEAAARRQEEDRKFWEACLASGYP